MISVCIWFSLRESTLKKEIDEERASLQKSINVTSALITQKDEELEKLRNEVSAEQWDAPPFGIAWIGYKLVALCASPSELAHPLFSIGKPWN